MEVQIDGIVAETLLHAPNLDPNVADKEVPYCIKKVVAHYWHEAHIERRSVSSM